MKFKDIKYTRPNITKIEENYKLLLDSFNSSKSAKQQKNIISKINKLRSEFWSSYTVAQVRHDINTANKKYAKEQAFLDANSPIIEKYETEFYSSLVNSKFKKELIEEFGIQLFKIAETATKTFDPKIINLLKKENKLTNDYSKLIASAKIKFNNKTLNLSQLSVYFTNPNQEIRKNAQKAKYEFFTKNSKKLDDIFDNLVKTRHKIAITLGYKNFTQLAYDRMSRTEYNEKDVAILRKQIKDTIVPVVKKIKKEQAKRLDLKNLKYYDEPIKFLSGNAEPKGNAKWIVKNAKKMYKELSPDTEKFFNIMTKDEMMDLETKKGKRGGGYCTFLQEQKLPFIFSNFNGTSADIDILTHEFGHAFQVYQTKNTKIPEYNWSTYEISEIHSMAMEFLTWPWMELFFKEDAQKYKFSHLTNMVGFLPYGTAVDEFQHFVYKNHTATPKERNEKWRKMEKKYLPWRDYEDNKFCNNGGFWQQQAHIYSTPFYYIDYVLAMTSALELWAKDNKNHKKAWDDYLSLCKAGGSKSFSELLKLANLKSPFNKNTLKPIIKEVEKHLNNVDTSKF